MPAHSLANSDFRSYNSLGAPRTLAAGSAQGKKRALKTAGMRHPKGVFRN